MSTLCGPGAMGFAGNTSDYWTTPFPHKPGERGRDKDGNEYVFVDFTATCYYGCLVQITSDYQASPLLGTAREGYRVGVVCGGVATTVNNMTSDHGGWVQIYGMFYGVQTHSASDALTSDNTVAYHTIAQTSVGSPSGTLAVIAQGAGTSIAQSSVDGIRIYGMWVLSPAQVSNLATVGPTAAQMGVSVSDTSGAVSIAYGVSSATSAFSGQVFIVGMNYPWVNGIAEPFSDATS